MQLFEKLKRRRALVEPEAVEEMDRGVKEPPRIPGKLRDRAVSDEAGRHRSPRTPTTESGSRSMNLPRSNSWQKDAATPSTTATTKSSSTQDELALSPEQITEQMSGNVSALRNRFSAPQTPPVSHAAHTGTGTPKVRIGTTVWQELHDVKVQNEELKASLEAEVTSRRQLEYESKQGGQKEAEWQRREQALTDEVESLKVQQYAVLEECADQLTASKAREQHLQDVIDSLELDLINTKATADALERLQEEHKKLQLAYDELQKSRSEVDGLRGGGGGTGGTSSPPVTRRTDGFSFAEAESELRATLTKDGGASTEELRAVVTATELTVQEARDDLLERELRIGSTQATLDEAKRELAAKELRERRAAYEKLHAAAGGDDEEVLESAIAEAQRTGVDVEEVGKAVSKLELLQSLTPEQKKTRARDKARAAAKKEAFLMVRRDDVEGLKKVVADFEESDWKSWKDHVGRNLRKYADYQKSGKTQAYFAELDAPPPPPPPPPPPAPVEEELPPVVVIPEPAPAVQERTDVRKRSVCISVPVAQFAEDDEEQEVEGFEEDEAQEGDESRDSAAWNPFRRLSAYLMSALGDEQQSPARRERAGSEPMGTRSRAGSEPTTRSRAGSIFGVRSRAHSEFTYCPSEGAISAHARSRAASVDAVFATQETPHLVRLRGPDGGEGTTTVKLLLLQDEEEAATAQDGEPASMQRKVSEPLEPTQEVEEEEEKAELSAEELERIAALKTPAFRAVCQDDTTKLSEILETVPREIWESWENKAGKDLLSLALERGSSAAYAVMERALGRLQERTWPSFEEREDVWVMLPGEVQPRRATVMEDTPSEAADVLVEFWDGDDPATRVDHSLVTKVSM